MQFLYPEFLWGLFLLIIPIIIHLFQFRFYKKIFFPNVRFLEKIQKESQSRNKIKRWLLLLSRMLFIIALLLAFAQPYFPGEYAAQDSSEQSAVSIYSDNSFSMTNEGPRGILLEEGRQTSRKVAESYLPSDRFLLLTNDFAERYYRFTNQNQVLEWINDIRESPSSVTLSEVVERKQDIFFEENLQAGNAYFVSDFQATFADLENIEDDTAVTLNFIPLEAESTSNVFVDSIWLSSPVLRPGQSSVINATIINEGNESRSGSVDLQINGNQQAIGNYDLEAGEQTTEELNFTVREEGWNTGKVEVEDHPITFDDAYFFAFKVREGASVMSINGAGENHYINALFGNDDFFNLTNTAPGDVAIDDIPTQDFIILNEIHGLSSGLLGQLEDFMQNGGNLFIVPSTEESNYIDDSEALFSHFGLSPISNITEEEQSAIRLNFESPLFSGVFREMPDQLTLPETFRNYQLRSTPLSDELIQLRDGTPLIDHYIRGQGNLYISSVPLRQEWTNLPEQGIFVPLLFRMALHEHESPEVAYSLGEETSLTFSAGDIAPDEVYQLSSDDLDEELIPAQNLRQNRLTIELADIEEAGIYDLEPTQTEPTSENSFKIALNYDRKESIMDFKSQQELENFAEGKNINVIDGTSADIEGEIQAAQQGTPLWRYFVILALAFLLAEIAIFKFL